MAVDRVRITAHAKLNLLLRILAREASSGYHQIETAFTLLELADELVVTRAGSGIALTVHGPDLGPPEANLAVRAARAVLEATADKFGVTIELTKRIPVRAGLAGGSSDAAAAMHAVHARGGNVVPPPPGCGCAAQGARSQPCTRASGCATTRRWSWERSTSACCGSPPGRRPLPVPNRPRL